MARVLAYGICRSLELALAVGVIAAAVYLSDYLR